MNSFRPEKVYNLDADRGKYVLTDVFSLGALRAGEGRQQEVGTKGWAQKKVE
jgi:hypothetical protein